MDKKNPSTKHAHVLLTLASTIVIVSLVLIDQATKVLAVNALSTGNSIPLIEGVLEFYYIKNTGMAFSLLTGMNIFFHISTPVILGIIIFFYVRIPIERKFLPIRALTLLVISGAIGNWIDRIFLGYVRDFIYFKLIDFPVFNVADIYVTGSVFVFIILFIFYYKEEDLDRILPKKRRKDG